MSVDHEEAWCCSQWEQCDPMIRVISVLALGAVLTNGALSALSSLCHGARAPQLAELETKETHVVYAGGRGTSFKDAVVIQGATNIIDLILAEGRWISNNYPAFQITGIIPNWRLKKGVYDVIEIRSARRKEEKIHFRFSEQSFTETPMDELWAYYVGDPVGPQSDGFTWIQRPRLEEQMKRIDPKRSLPFLVRQLDDSRLTKASWSDPWGDGKWKQQRVCDFAARLLLDDLRYARSKEAVFPQYSWKPFQPSSVLEEPDNALEAIKKWWLVEGQFLTERGEVRWGTVPRFDPSKSQK